ncbi:MAG: NAD(P)-dependent oxidoreductase, partial [Sphingobacteriaceae bacterium]
SVLAFSDLLTCDAIVYCAATGVQANKATDTALVYEINAFLPIKILNYLNDNNFVGTWVSFGSYFEIGNNDAEHYFTETDVIASELPVPNHYCSSKRLLTRFISNGLGTAKMFHFILPTIYGSRENPARLIPYIVDALKADRTVQLSAGTQIRQYLHCKDVASLVNLVISSSYESGIYNVANGTPIKISDLVKSVFHLFKRNADSSLGTLSTRDESMKFLALDIKNLSIQFSHWEPTISLQAGISEYL